MRVKVWAPEHPTAWARRGNDTVDSVTHVGMHGVLIGVDGDDGIVVGQNNGVHRIPLVGLVVQYYDLEKEAATSADEAVERLRQYATSRPITDARSATTRTHPL